MSEKDNSLYNHPDDGFDVCGAGPSPIWAVILFVVMVIIHIWIF